MDEPTRVELASDRDRLAEELAQLHRAVKEGNDNLADFLHSLVHEMRSPLTVIAGYADMLRTDALAGFFCGGEIGPVGGKAFLHGFTATLAVFLEP